MLISIKYFCCRSTINSHSCVCLAVPDFEDISLAAGTWRKPEEGNMCKKCELQISLRKKINIINYTDFNTRKINNMWDSHRQSRHEDLHVQLGETTWNTKHVHKSNESENIKKKWTMKLRVWNHSVHRASFHFRILKQPVSLVKGTK